MTIIGISGRKSTQIWLSDSLAEPSQRVPPPLCWERCAASPGSVSDRPCAGASGKCSLRTCRDPTVAGARLHVRRRTSGSTPALQPLSGPGAAKAALGSPATHQNWGELSLQRGRRNLPEPWVDLQSETPGKGDSECACRGCTSHGFGVCLWGRALYPARGTGRGQSISWTGPSL